MRRDNADHNAKELLANLERDGWRCQRIAKATDRASGIPDVIVSRKGSRLNHLLELKNLGGKLRESQVKFIGAWPGCAHVATNSLEANLLLRECEGLTKPAVTMPDRCAKMLGNLIVCGYSHAEHGDGSVTDHEYQEKP